MYYFFSTFLDFHEFSFLPKTWEPWCKVIWFSNWNSLEKLEVVVFEFTSKRDESSCQTKSEKQMNLIIKFRFSKKATNYETIFHLIWHSLSKCQIKWKVDSNFCGLFRMSEFTIYARKFVNYKMFLNNSQICLLNLCIIWLNLITVDAPL